MNFKLGHYPLGGQFDHGPIIEVADCNALGSVAALGDEPRHTSACCAQWAAGLAVGDLEAAHRGAMLLGVVDRSGTVLALDLGKLGTGGADLFVQRRVLWGFDCTGGVLCF